MSRIADRARIPELRRLALSAEEPLVAANALRALGQLRAVRRKSEFVALLRDPRLRVRQEAVVALGRSGDLSLVEELAPLLGEEEAGLRPLVIQALGRLGGDRARALIASVLDDPEATEVDKIFARTAMKGG